MKTVYVDQDECTGCQACVEDLDSVFRMNDDDVAEVHNAKGASEDEIQEIIDSCPAECIHWKE